MKNAEMKWLFAMLIGWMPSVVFGQQFPFMEGYNINPFSLSPAYAGIQNNKTLFVDYRSDWTGMAGGPTTYELSYNDKFTRKKKLGGNFIYDQSDIYKNNVAFGGRFIYDKTDIFTQMLLLGTYAYEVRIAKEHKVNFGLSAGFYRNAIDFAKYFNNPDYVQDMALINGQGKSEIKFATDISALYRYKETEAGILFSNVMFGSVRYRNSDVTYKPMKNYLVHASYLFNIDKNWSAKSTFILRGGQNIPVQLEVSPTITWKDRFWETTFIRTSGFGLGFGGEVYDGIILNYSYNVISNVSLYTFGSNQLSLGVKIFNFMKNKKISG
jgi:type IX secretion system PorP/SprF family membrane protein